MTLSLLGPPNSFDLLSLIGVKAELGINSVTYDTLLSDLIGTASNMVYDLLGYSAFRAPRRETLLGSRRNDLVLTARPVLTLDAASYNGVAVDVSTLRISNANAGIITRENFVEFDSSDIRDEWQIDYTSGWFLANDDFSGDLTVDDADDSYNSPTSAFPLYVLPGDMIAATGWTGGNTANNGLKTIETATQAKITVQQALTAVPVAESHPIGFKNVPAALERAAMEAVRSFYRARTQSGNLASQRIDDVELRYATDASAQLAAVQQTMSRYLGNWVSA